MSHDYIKGWNLFLQIDNFSVTWHDAISYCNRNFVEHL